MKQKFAIIDPLTGNYVEVYTEQERDALVAQKAWEFFLVHTHSVPYSIVTINEDGSETWVTPNGEPKLSPTEIAAQIAAWEAQQKV